PPVYFRAWSPNAPPRWGEHWGPAWEQRRRGWDNWNRSGVPPPAPLPVYQRQYAGDRYPRVEQQPVLQGQHYRYQPRDPVVQQHYQAQRTQAAPVTSPQASKGAPKDRVTATQEPAQRGASTAPRGQSPHKGSGDAQKGVSAQAPPQQAGVTSPHHGQQPQQGAAEPERAQRSQGEDNGPQSKIGRA